MFKNLEEAIEWVNTRHRFSKKMDLSQISAACELLGHPELSFKTVHVGGTNGKGSTANYIFNILKEAGYKTALYTSPYVVSFNERIRVEDEFISDNDILRILNFLYDFNDDFAKTHEPLSFFEIVTLMSFLFFKEKKIDIAVFEVGLGGRLDATNVIHPILSVITNIQKDHMNILGKTYKKIATEKLGIVKEGIPLATTEKRESLMPLFLAKTQEKNSPLYKVRNIRNISLNNGTHFTYQGKKYTASLIGTYQAYNAALAIESAHIISQTSAYKISEKNIEDGLKETKWPGRFEVFGNVIMDGGHNPEGIIALKNSIEKYTNKKINVIFCAMADKDTKSMVKILDSFADSIIFTQIDYYRSEKAANLISLSQINDKIFIEDFEEALATGLKKTASDEILLITGSLYFISAIRKLYLGEKSHA